MPSPLRWAGRAREGWKESERKRVRARVMERGWRIGGEEEKGRRKRKGWEGESKCENVREMERER